MKKIRLSICIVLFVLGLTFICAPFISYKSEYLSLVDLLIKYSFNWQIAVIFSAIILFLVSIVLLYFAPRNCINIIGFLGLIYSGLLMIFSKVILNSLIDSKIFYMSISPIICGIVSFIIAFIYSSYIFDANSITVKDIIEIAIFISFAFVLDFAIFKIKIGANGGSISFAMVPLFIICLRKGFVKGFIACGIVYGLINCFVDGYGLVTYPFDYLLGFGSISLVALFRKFIFTEKLHFKNFLFLTLGVIIAVFGRTMASTLSGIIIYKLNFVSSLVYQLLYIGPSAGIVLAILIILLPYLNSRNNKMNKQYKY